MHKISRGPTHLTTATTIQDGLRSFATFLALFPFGFALGLVLYYDLWLLLTGTWMIFA